MPWREPTVVAVPPLLRELICHLARSERGVAGEREARGLLGALLTPLATAQIDVPLPKDPRARRVADALLKKPIDPRTLAALGRAAGASARTLARVWQAETGMSFGQWRSQLRIRCALAHLAEGRTVSETARLVGYESTSAFVAAFRRRIGMPPGAYFETAAATE